MNTLSTRSLFFLPIIILVACVGPQEKNGDAAQLRKKIEEVKKEKVTLENTLRELEQQ